MYGYVCMYISVQISYQLVAFINLNMLCDYCRTMYVVYGLNFYIRIKDAYTYKTESKL